MSIYMTSVGLAALANYITKTWNQTTKKRCNGNRCMCVYILTVKVISDSIRTTNISTGYFCRS